MVALEVDRDRAEKGSEERGQGFSAEAGRSRRIIHIDMDAFYTSVEQRDNPELRGKPVAIGGSRERGVVAAASYEARKFGVHSAMPSITAKRKCPDLIFVSPRFNAYKAISLQIREIFAEFTPIIEPLSLDEAYLDVTENLKGMISATQIAEEIRARIRAETGLTASAGVSYNKFLAKLASDHRKPDGLFVITPAMGPAFVETLPVRKFHGVGPATAAKMARFGIETGLDLKAQTLAFLQQHFGKAGPYYYGVARGVDERRNAWSCTSNTISWLSQAMSSVKAIAQAFLRVSASTTMCWYNGTRYCSVPNASRPMSSTPAASQCDPGNALGFYRHLRAGDIRSLGIR